MPESTERVFCVTSSVVTKRSLCLMSSHWFASFVFTRANEPLTFSPRRRNESLPLARPSRTRSSALSRSSNQVPPSSGE